MSNIDRFKDTTTLGALATGGDPAILAALAGGPFAGVRDAWGAADLDLSWDKGDPFGSATGALFALCDLLRLWESPVWGNTGGRYGHHAGIGGLSGADLEDLERGTFDDSPDEDVREARREWESVYLQGLFDYLQEHPAHLADVVQLGDMLSQVIDRCRELGTDY